MLGALQGEPEGKGAVDYENRGHEQENVKSNQVIPTDALRSPRAMMVVSLNADIAVLAVDSSTGYVVTTFSAKTTSLNAYIVLPIFAFFSSAIGRAMPGSLNATNR